MTGSPSTTAKILYRLVGRVSSILGGLFAGTIFKQVWKRANSGQEPDAPTALRTEYPFNEILVAAAVQGVIYSVVKTVIDCQGARFSRSGRASGRVADVSQVPTRRFAAGGDGRHATIAVMSMVLHAFAVIPRGGPAIAIFVGSTFSGVIAAIVAMETERAVVVWAVASFIVALVVLSGAVDLLTTA